MQFEKDKIAPAHRNVVNCESGNLDAARRIHSPSGKRQVSIDSARHGEANEVAARRKIFHVLDLKLDGTSGFDAIRHIRSEFPSARILVLSNFQGSEDVYRAMQAGARGYLTKDADGRQVADALQVVAGGGRYIPKSLESRLAECIPKGGITPRERTVLELLAKGLSTAEIAQQSQIAEKTVRIHISNVLEKLGARDRTQALVLALKRGIIHLDT